MGGVAFVCGGTAGHIHPALAIAETLEKARPDLPIFFIGRADSMEERILEKTHYPYMTIAASPLYFNPVALYRMGRDLVRGRAQARKILEAQKPAAVVVTGGYVCAPVVLEARRLNIPVLIHESNAFAGRTNRYLGARSDVVCISFEEARSAFPKAGRVVNTGNPVRPEFLTVDHEAARRTLRAMDPRATVLIAGGSQGARSLCRVTLDMAEQLKSRPEARDLRFVLSTGRKSYETWAEEARSRDLGSVLELRDFIDDMPLWMAGSELFVSRSGAISCTEIAALGCPSILVPYPYAAEDHQTKNAMAFVDKGAALLVPDDKLDATKLLATILELLKNPSRLERMGEGARSLAAPDAAEKIVAELMKLIGA